MVSARIPADPILGAGDRMIAELSDDERMMLQEVAQRLRNHKTRNVVARKSLDRMAFLFARAAERQA